MSRELRRAAILFVLTLASMFWVGAQWEGVDPLQGGALGLLRGYTFALPLMAILLAHELGHYFAARLHKVDASLPYFIPLPLALGTLGAVILMRSPIRLRNALFDIGAAGPLVGLVVALPVLIYGIATSPVQPIDPALTYIVEGRSLLYLALLQGLKGPIPDGYDIMLNPTALAGWAGLLVTMINLVPIGQLDGGHVAYALFGMKQDVYSRWGRATLLVIACLVGALGAWNAWNAGARAAALWDHAFDGRHWLMWWFVLSLMARFTGGAHPPTEPSELSPVRRVLAWFTLLLFVLLFMPRWISVGP
jgi:membrane-associated protease RseP (regulator of RpoE activity)